MKKVAENIPSVRRPLPHPRPCPESVIRRAFAQADPAERLMLALGAECGLRRAEIAAVNSTDAIETENGFVLVVVGKGDRQRIVPAEPNLAKTIQDKHGWCFPGRWKGHVEASYVGKHLARLLKPYTAHSLRHRYATDHVCHT